jgi:hypothetical protein
MMLQISYDKFQTFAWLYIHYRVRHTLALRSLLCNRLSANLSNLCTNAKCRALFFYDRP